jgi:hypothetical protein
MGVCLTALLCLGRSKEFFWIESKERKVFRFVKLNSTQGHACRERCFFDGVVFRQG